MFRPPKIFSECIRVRNGNFPTTETSLNWELQLGKDAEPQISQQFLFYVSSIHFHINSNNSSICLHNQFVKILKPSALLSAFSNLNLKSQDVHKTHSTFWFHGEKIRTINKVSIDMCCGWQLGDVKYKSLCSTFLHVQKPHENLKTANTTSTERDKTVLRFFARFCENDEDKN